jgi:hypothetical protein
MLPRLKQTARHQHGSRHLLGKDRHLALLARLRAFCPKLATLPPVAIPAALPMGRQLRLAVLRQSAAEHLAAQAYGPLHH